MILPFARVPIRRDLWPPRQQSLSPQALEGMNALPGTSRETYKLFRRAGSLHALSLVTSWLFR
jgi:hypothetical protein